MQETKNKSG